MKAINGIAHIGITVEDLERSVTFYRENFGFDYLRGAHFTQPFFAQNESLYELPPESTQCHTAVLVSPDKGIQLELFRFSHHRPPEPIPWNRSGITHLAFVTDDVPAMAEQLRENGVVFCMNIGVRPDGGRWVFIRDPDGNLIEIMEPFRL